MTDAAVEAVAATLDTEYVNRQTRRMQAALRDEDVDLAIGTAKEFVETACKTVLSDEGVECPRDIEFGKLVREALKQLALVPEGVATNTRGAEVVRKTLGSLAGTVGGMGEPRNLFGTGHGRDARSRGLEERHARLAVGAASVFGQFLLDTRKRRLS